jgi:hypothetical protein
MINRSRFLIIDQLKAISTEGRAERFSLVLGQRFVKGYFAKPYRQWGQSHPVENLINNHRTTVTDHVLDK